ncbi:hypothetical protein CDE51_07970 [Pasteurella multocida]|nr:hypothetical protein CDE51_07970 [Pasteurella multocida]
MDCNEVKLNPKTFQLMVQIISRPLFFVDNVNINNDMGFGSDLFDGTMATVPFANHSQGYFF